MKPKVISLAHYIYVLRGSKNFESFINSIKTKDFKSCYWEISCAGTFKEQGYLVEFIKESGIKGNDYDILVTKGSVAFEVEIKSRDSVSNDIKSLRNVLNDSRQQVPKNGNGIIYVSIPSELVNGDVKLKLVDDCVSEFLRSTNRIKYVILEFKTKEMFANGKRATTSYVKAYPFRLFDLEQYAPLFVPAFWHIDENETTN